jgi:Phenazine biosynthesis-like protein
MTNCEGGTLESRSRSSAGGLAPRRTRHKRACQIRDPVTGSAHCTLVPYWAKRLGKTAFEARQLSRRGGSLHCALNGDRVDRPHRTGLLVVANAAVDIQYSRDEAYLGHRRFVRTRLWKQVTDLGDLTFGLLPRNKEFLAECLASRVL